jgi:hypothetical protein
MIVLSGLFKPPEINVNEIFVVIIKKNFKHKPSIFRYTYMQIYFKAKNVQKNSTLAFRICAKIFIAAYPHAGHYLI